MYHNIRHSPLSSKYFVCTFTPSLYGHYCPFTDFKCLDTLGGTSFSFVPKETYGLHHANYNTWETIYGIAYRYGAERFWTHVFDWLAGNPEYCQGLYDYAVDWQDWTSAIKIARIYISHHICSFFPNQTLEIYNLYISTATNTRNTEQYVDKCLRTFKADICAAASQFEVELYKFVLTYAMWDTMEDLSVTSNFTCPQLLDHCEYHPIFWGDVQSATQELFGKKDDTWRLWEFYIHSDPRSSTVQRLIVNPIICLYFKSCLPLDVLHLIPIQDIQVHLPSIMAIRDQVPVSTSHNKAIILSILDENPQIRLKDELVEYLEPQTLHQILELLLGTTVPKIFIHSLKAFFYLSTLRHAKFFPLQIQEICQKISFNEQDFNIIDAFLQRLCYNRKPFLDALHDYWIGCGFIPDFIEPKNHFYAVESEDKKVALEYILTRMKSKNHRDVILENNSLSISLQKLVGPDKIHKYS